MAKKLIEPKVSVKAKKLEATAMSKASRLQSFIDKGICTTCNKIKVCKLYKNYGPARPGERCMDFQEK